MPEEAACADLWRKWNERNSRPILDYVLDKGVNPNNPREPSIRDYRVSATIIQWLATPVGSAFVEELIGKNIIKLQGIS